MWKLHIYITTKLPVYEVYLIKKLVLLIKAIIKKIPQRTKQQEQLTPLTPLSPCFIPIMTLTSYSNDPTLHSLSSVYNFFTTSKVSFLSSVPLHGMAFPFHFDRNPFWTPSDQTLRHSFSQKYGPAMFSFPCCCFHLSQVSVCCPFKSVCKLSFV